MGSIGQVQFQGRLRVKLDLSARSLKDRSITVLRKRKAEEQSSEKRPGRSQQLLLVLLLLDPKPVLLENGLRESGAWG